MLISQIETKLRSHLDLLLLFPRCIGGYGKSYETGQNHSE